MFLFVFGFESCKKDTGSITGNTQGYQIKIVNGDHQTDTIGMPLRDTIVFEATRNNRMLSFGHVEVYGYDCAGNPLTPILYDVGANSYAGLYIKHVWWLNGNVGIQKLTAVLMDSLMNRRDSVTVTATGQPPSHGWYHSGCFPENNNVRSFTQLPSGRILAALRQKDYPYYSDDEGMSWQPLTTVPSRDDYTIVISNDSNEVFLSVNAFGMLYSGDGGLTWAARNNGLPPISDRWGDIQYTKSGKLFSYTGGGVFKSDDKGLNWHLVTFGLLGYGFYGASSTSDGTIYANNNTLIQSADGGETFRPVYSFESANYFFIDTNDDIYATGYDNFSSAGMSVYRSQDKAQTWNRLCAVPVPKPGFQMGISHMTKLGDRYFFYSTGENLLVETKDFISFYTYEPPVVENGGRQSFQYIVTTKGHIVISTEFQGLFYFIP
jgi:hypothetical protein